jgi:hypothetical protein
MKRTLLLRLLHVGFLVFWPSGCEDEAGKRDSAEPRPGAAKQQLIAQDEQPFTLEVARDALVTLLRSGALSPAPSADDLLRYEPSSLQGFVFERERDGDPEQRRRYHVEVDLNERRFSLSVTSRTRSWDYRGRFQRGADGKWTAQVPRGGEREKWHPPRW